MRYKSFLDKIDSFSREFDSNSNLAKNHGEYDIGDLSQRMKAYVESSDEIIESDVEYDFWNEILEHVLEFLWSDLIAEELQIKSNEDSMKSFKDPLIHFRILMFNRV